jgi:hypothetical protein
MTQIEIEQLCYEDFSYYLAHGYVETDVFTSDEERIEALLSAF